MSDKSLFVGGPWDGRREVINGLPNRFYVEKLQKVSQEICKETGKAKDGPVTEEKVVYARVNVGGGVMFYVALDQKDYGKHPTDTLIQELFKGYRNL